MLDLSPSRTLRVILGHSIRVPARCAAAPRQPNVLPF